jgi:sugar lactone lactonase YvrE
VAGGNGEGNGDNQLDGPRDVYVDPSGNIFIVDWRNKRIQMWPVNSKQGTTIANNTGPWESFHGIHGNNRATGVYFTENTLGGGSKVLRYSSSGIYETMGVSAAEDTFSGLYVDQCDNIYVTNSDSTLKFSDGNTTREVLMNSFRPADVTLDQYGNLYVVEHNQCRVKRLSVRDGTSEIIINKSSVYGTDDEHLSWPRSLALDSKGNVYVSDSSNNRVQKFLFESGDLFC